MSSISPDFIHSVGYLYEEIHAKDQGFLNEESEFYNEEVAELTEDIILTLALQMFSEGYYAETFLKFLASSDEEVILEKYLNIDINFLYEETVNDEFLEEQLELLEKYGLQFLGKIFNSTKGFARKGVEKLATSGVEKKIGKKFTSQGGVDLQLAGSKTGRTGSATDRKIAALDKLAKDKAKKSGIDVPQGKLNPKQATDLIKKARITQAIKGTKNAAAGALLTGLGVLGGYGSAKLAGAGSGSEKTIGSPKQTPSSAKDDFLKGSALAKLGGKEGRIKDGEFRTMSWSPESKKRYAAATKGAAKPTPSSATPTSTSSGSSSKPSSTPAVKPKSQDVAKPGETKMQQWARLNPKLAAKVEPGQSGYEEISQTRVKPSSYEKKDQTPTQGPSGAKIDTKSVDDAKKEFENRMKEKNKVTTSPSTTKESYEPYDVILEYLIGRGHVDTIEEAHYVMLEMDESAVCRIIEEYNDYVLAEEVSEWVNDLLEEGYDLSEYTWDDIVEYYVTESNR